MNKKRNKTFTLYISKPVFEALMEKKEELTVKELDMLVMYAHIGEYRFERQLKIDNMNSDVQVKVDRDHWHIHLHSTILHEFFGNSYRKICDLMEKYKIMGRSKTYLPAASAKKGEKAQSKAVFFYNKFAKYLAIYLDSKYARKYANEFAPVYGEKVKYVITDHCFVKRLAKNYTKLREYSKLDPRVADAYDNLEHFSVDEEALEAVLEDLSSKGYSKEKCENERIKADVFNGIASGEDQLGIYVKHDAYGRIHTNITNMKREIRLNALKCDGKDVGEVDIKSSQPAFLCLLHHRYLSQLAATEDSFIEFPSSFVRFNPFFAPHNKDSVLEAYANELETYTELVTSHRIYEVMADACNNDPSIKEHVTRKDAKTALISFMFSPVHFDPKKKPLRNVVKNVWQDQFPTMYNAMCAMKKNGYAALAHELQKIESSFVFDRVLPRIKEEIGCPYCTVHDSIIVPREYTEAVKAIVDRELLFMEIPTVTEIEVGMIFENMIPPTYAELAVFAEMDNNPLVDHEESLEAVAV